MYAESTSTLIFNSYCNIALQNCSHLAVINTVKIYALYNVSFNFLQCYPEWIQRLTISSVNYIKSPYCETDNIQDRCTTVISQVSLLVFNSTIQQTWMYKYVLVYMYNIITLCNVTVLYYNKICYATYNNNLLRLQFQR